MILLTIAFLLLITPTQCQTLQQCQFSQYGLQIYAYWNNQWCVPCQNYCTCSSYMGCSQRTCPAGYVLSDESCVACPSGCAGCTISGGPFSFSCYSCSTGYQLISDICVLLSTFVLNVANIKQPYTVYGPVYNQQTNQAISCLGLNSETSLCSLCSEGSFLNEFNFCESCPANCVCNSRGTCSYCMNGYYWSSLMNQDLSLQQVDYSNGYYAFGRSGACTACTQVGVSTCSNAVTPLTCKLGYFLSEGQCIICSPGCISCNNAQNCLVCTIGYYVNNGGCSLCYGNTSSNILCLNCSTGQSYSCDICQQNYISVNGICTSCNGNGCMTCIGQSSLAVCSECYNGYCLNDGQCVKCSGNAMYCKCVNGVGIPTQCVNGYLLVNESGSNNATCAQNINNCLLMVDSNQKCSTCLVGSYLVNGVCQDCASTYLGCTNCQVQNNQLQCTSCSSNNISTTNYALVSTQYQCVECPSTCLTCNQNQSCLSCLSGYLLIGGECIGCEIANCESCQQGNNTQNCNNCMPGYFMTTNNNSQQCNPCPWGCATCGPNGQQCQTCLNGFYLNNGGCNIGTVACSKNNEDGTCQQCMYGFRLQNGYCFPCIDFTSGFVCKANAGQTCSFQIIQLVLVVFVLLAI